MTLLDKLRWRYATKQFDPNRKVSAENIAFLREAIRLSVSSYGLQLYKVLIIANPTIREALRRASYDQAQITDASLLFVFCNFTRGYDQQVDAYIERIAQNQGGMNPGLENYRQSIKASIHGKSEAERQSWAEKQTYLALNNLLLACADRHIDACPMEGFDQDAYDQILGLREVGLHASVIAPVGYRSVTDQAQHWKKIRKSQSELFEVA